jgi:pimeloyl-ACP methyl ester carboxylesterase
MTSTATTPAVTITNNFDFSFADNLPQQMGDHYRLYIGEPTVAVAPNAPRFLFVPGAYHGAWCYAHYMRYFMERGIACAAIDFWGHGSQPQDEGFTRVNVAELGRELIAAFDSLSGPTVVVGHSMGALPSAICATQREVAGLVLLAPSPPGNLPGAQPIPAMPVDTVCAVLSASQIRDRFIAADESRDVSAIIERLTGEASNVLNDRYLLRVVVDAKRQRAPGICIEAGRDNPERHPVGQDQAVADFLNLDFVRLDTAAHCMMYADEWETSAALIETWYRNTFK